MPTEHQLVNMTVPDVTAQLERNPVIVLPTGSVEQHGKHLPYGTDWFASELFAKKLADEIDALLVPFTPLGVTPIHMGFTGTISLRPETYMSLMKDVVRAMVKHGAKRVVVVNWHELNDPLIRIVAGELQQESDVRFIVVQAHYVTLELYGQETGLTHGGLLEALPIMVYDNSLVHLDRGDDPSPHGTGNKMDKLRRRKETYTVFHDVRDVYPTGWYGTLEGASEEYAQEVVAGVTQQIVAYVNESLAALTE